MTREADDDLRLPDPLRDDLAALYRADVEPSPVRDQAILNAARAHLAGRNRSLLLRRTAGAAAAVAAVVLVTVVLVRTPQRPRLGTGVTTTTSSAPADRWTSDGDSNNDGVVDIRDALVLARKVDAGPVRWTRWEDLNRDQVVDRRDVDAIAALAVRIESGVVR